MDFKTKYGPYALVAGASEGLGAAYAEALAKRGLNLVLTARRKDVLETFGKVLKEKYPVNVICCPADMGDYGAAKKLIASLNVSIGLLVYNAAYCPVGLFDEISEEQLAQVVAVNVKGPLLLAKLLLPSMLQNHRGGIVLMSSLAGTQGSPKLAAYAASKSFNAILAEGLWQELKPQGIDVIACVAGAILTPGYRHTQQARQGGRTKQIPEVSATAATSERKVPKDSIALAPGTLTAAKVAETALNALGKYPIVVPGWVNKVGRFVLGRLLPRTLAIKIMSANTGSLS
jgi:short-subunit dehydrogenase